MGKDCGRDGNEMKSTPSVDGMPTKEELKTPAPLQSAVERMKGLCLHVGNQNQAVYFSNLSSAILELDSLLKKLEIWLREVASLADENDARTIDLDERLKKIEELIGERVEL